MCCSVVRGTVGEVDARLSSGNGRGVGGAVMWLLAELFYWRNLEFFFTSFPLREVNNA